MLYGPRLGAGLLGRFSPKGPGETGGTEEPVAPFPLTPPFPFLNLHVYPANLITDPDDPTG